MEPTLARQRIDVRPANPTIGAEVAGVDLASAPDDDDLMRALQELLQQHLVLFFRDQRHLTPETQIRFAGWFGPFEYHAFAKPHPDHPEMTVLDQVTPERDGANSWHSDSSFMETPALGSVLRAVQLPPLGGDTCWASMYAAWDALSPPMQAMLEQLEALHDITMPLEKAIAGGHSISADLDAVRAAWPPMPHPIARTHPRPATSASTSTTTSPRGSSVSRRRRATRCCGSCCATSSDRTSRCASAGSPGRW